MQDRTGGRRAARVAPIDEGPVADGVVARIVERAIDNPAKTGGLFVMALTAATIVSNALLLQTGRHPGPLFITRPEAVATPAPVPLPRVRASQTDVAAPPIQAAPVAAPTPAKLALDTKPIKSLQSALAARGIYHGVVDGVLGSRTRAAISAYEKANGLPVTGEPSTLLLDTIEAQPLKAPSKPAAMAPAPTDTLVVGSTPPVPVPAPKVTPVTTVAVGPVAATGPVSVAMPAPEPTPAAAAASLPNPAAAAERQRLQNVQNILNRIGYGPLAANGESTEETANAIRRFELDNGLPITGAPNDRVLSRLTAIGASGSG